MSKQELQSAFSYEFAKKIASSPEHKISWPYFFVKRLCDIIFSFSGIVALSPLLLCVAVAVKVTSRGHVVYTQERVGRGGKTFTMYKFRTMVDGAESNRPVWAKKNDDRATAIGKWLRNYHIDELLQLFNIFSGDMSIVGPRPEREYFYNKFEIDIPNFRDRLAVKPGLTGLAQINGGYDITPKEKFLIDKRYISELSVSNDVRIMLKTAGVVCRGTGAR